MEVRCTNCKNYYNDMFDVCPHCGYVEGGEPKEAFLLHPGMLLKNRYEIGMVLGYGGFGATYKAWDTKLETSVAIKEYFQSGVVNRIPGDQKVFVFSDKKQVEFKDGLGRFLEEARNTVKFSKHDNIVNVYDYFEENDTAYIVMEYLQGRTLKEILYENGGSLDVETSLKIFFAVLRALKAVHAEGIVHRDVSPDNIFLTDSGKIKLIDFGAARFTQKKVEDRDVVVKPGFAPPEQYRVKGKQGTWTDIYAIGATMYRILTGMTPEESVNRMVEDNLLPPDRIQPLIPEFLSSTVMKCLRLEEELRFQDIEQVEQVLKKGRIVKSRRAEIGSRKRKRGFLFALVLLLCTSMGAAGSYAYTKMAQKAANQPVELSVWLMAEEEKKETELAAFETIAEQFEKSYPNVQFEINCYGDEEYVTKLAEAMKAGQQPDLYESIELASGDDMPKALSLKKLYKEIGNGTYGEILKHYTLTQETGNILPLSCDIPIIYENTVYEGKEGSAESTLTEFLEGKSKNYIGGVDCYLQIREAKLGQYSVSCPEQSEIVFENPISINAAISKKEQQAALQFMEYLLGQEAQEILCLDYCGGIPVNQAAEDTYFIVFGELEILKQYLNEAASIAEEKQ